MQCPKFTFLALSAILISGISCKQKVKSTLQDGAVSASEAVVVGNLAAINQIDMDYTMLGKPLYDEDEDKNTDESTKLKNLEKIKNTKPVPNGCKADAWQADLRWMAKPLTELEGYMGEGGDIRVRIAARQAMYHVVSTVGLICDEEYITTSLDALMGHVEDDAGVTNSPICNSFMTCSTTLGLLGFLAKIIPESQALKVAFDRMERLLHNVKFGATNSPNSVAILEFEVKSYKAHSLFYGFSKLESHDTDGIPVQLTTDQTSQLEQTFSELNRFVFNKLFVVNQWRNSVNIDPDIVRLFIVNDMVADSDAYNQLDSTDQEMIAIAAMGFFDAAWQLEVLNNALEMYVERLSGSNATNPTAWLKKIHDAADAWRQAETGFEMPSENAAPTPLVAGKFDWQSSLNPLVAFMSLNLFISKEVKLPFRSTWISTLKQMYEFIPATLIHQGIQQQYIYADILAKQERAFLLNSLKSQGIVNEANLFESLTDKEKAALPQNAKDELKKKIDITIATRNKRVTEMFEQLLGSEETIALNFPGFKSVYWEMTELYRRMGSRSMIMQSVVNELSPKEGEKDSESAASDETKVRLFGNIDTSNAQVIEQWVRITCIDRITQKIRDPSTSMTIPDEPFFLDNSIIIKDPPCVSRTSGEMMTNLQSLNSRISGYGGTLTAHREIDRAMTNLKLNVVVSLVSTVAIAMPIAGMAANLAAKGATILIERAATIAAMEFLKRKLVQSIFINGVSIFVNFQTFSAVAALQDNVLSGMLGMQQQQQNISQTRGQFLYSQTMGLATFGAMSYVSRFSNFLARKIPGVTSKVATKELSTYASRYQQALKPTFREKFAHWGVGTLVDTAYFHGTGKLGEYVGKDILQLYGEMTKDQRAISRLYAQGKTQELTHSFVMAVAFRTMAAYHGNVEMPTNAEFDKASNSARGSINGKLSPDEAFMILKLSPGANSGAISAAIKILKRSHPDRLIAGFEKVLNTAGSTLNAKVRNDLKDAANRGTSFAEIQTKIQWPANMPEASRNDLEGAYRQYSDSVRSFSQGLAAAAVLQKGSK